MHSPSPTLLILHPFSSAHAKTYRTLHAFEGQKIQAGRRENAHSVKRKTHFSSVHVSPAEAPTYGPLVPRLELILPVPVHHSVTPPCPHRAVI